MERMAHAAGDAYRQTRGGDDVERYACSQSPLGFVRRCASTDKVRYRRSVAPGASRHSYLLDQALHGSCCCSLAALAAVTVRRLPTDASPSRRQRKTACASPLRFVLPYRPLPLLRTITAHRRQAGRRQRRWVSRSIQARSANWPRDRGGGSPGDARSAHLDGVRTIASRPRRPLTVDLGRREAALNGRALDSAT